MKNFHHITGATVAPLIRALCVAGVLSAVSMISHAENIKIGMNFLHARKLLLAHGWHPLVDKLPGEYIGVENLLIEKGIKEVRSCAIDKSVCLFFYQKHGNCLKLQTEGEIVSSMKVNYFSHSCPD